MSHFRYLCVVVLCLLSVIAAFVSSSQLQLCSTLQSPVTLKIPTYKALAPLGNNNGLVGQAIWAFEPVGAALTRNNITFNLCQDPESTSSSLLLQYVESMKLTININQTLDYSIVQPIVNKYEFNSTTTSPSLPCIGGNIEIDHDIPSVNITHLVTLGVVDDRDSVYAVYLINAIEELVDFESTPPPLPVLLPA